MNGFMNMQTNNHSCLFKAFGDPVKMLPTTFIQKQNKHFRTITTTTNQPHESMHSLVFGLLRSTWYATPTSAKPTMILTATAIFTLFILVEQFWKEKISTRTISNDLLFT